MGQIGLHLNRRVTGRSALNSIHKIKSLLRASEHINVPARPYVSPSKKLNGKIHLV